MTTSVRDGELETAVEMAAALRSGDVTSVELVERALRRADAWQPVTNAFSQLWADEALDVARAVDAGRTTDGPSLAGVPVAVKDLFDVAGHETSGCCAAYRGRVASNDAPVVARLRAAGLVMIGKTNQHELAAGGTNTVSACGATRNPWDPSRMTGGSSGGSGAAVASGVVPVALGSDTGGSIRIPASLCGTFGLKPTHGRLSLKGLVPLAPSMDCAGPMSSTARDLAVAYEALAGDGPSGAERLDGCRIGVPDGFFDTLLHDDVRALVRETAALFTSAGLETRPVDGSALPEVRRTWMDACTPEFFDAHPDLHGERRDLIAASVREWFEQGERATPEERDDASRRRDGVRAWFDDALSGVDVLLIPTTPYPAPRLDADLVGLGADGEVTIEARGPGSITCSVNLAGLPALNLPAGRSGALPIGVSLVGRRAAEPLLLELAGRWERSSGYRPRRPSPVAA